MNSLELIVYTSIIVWVFPAIRHIKTEYAYYFLLLGIIDPLKLGIYYFLGTDIELVTIPFSLILIYSIIKSKISERFTLPIILCIIFISIIGYQISILIGIKLIAHVFILIFLFSRMIKILLNDNKWDIHLLVICFYEFSIIFKNLHLSPDIIADTYFFHITSIFQLGFGLFFAFFNHWSISLNTKD